MSGEERREAVPAGYKMTEVGVIPEDWETVKLDSQIDVIDGDRGNAYPSSTDFRRDGHCLFLNAGNVTEAGFKFVDCSFISQQKDDRLGEGKLHRYDIVLTTRGTVGNVAYYDDEVPYTHIRVNSGMVLLRCRVRELRSDFLYHFLRSRLFGLQVERLTFGSAQPQLTVRGINSFRVIVPPLPEQRAIAEALSDVDNLLDALDRLIAKKRAVKQAAMQQLLTGKTRLPGFAGEWEETTLGEIGTFSKGAGISRNEVVTEGLPCIRYGEIYTHHDDVIRSFYSFITNHTASRSVRLKPGDLLFAGSGETREEIGKCVGFDLDVEAYAGGDTVILSQNNHEVRFLGYLLNTPEINVQKAQMGQGDAVVHISARSLAQVAVQLPPLSEQRAIAEVLSDMDEEITALEKRRDKTRRIKEGMMQQLLTGRVRLLKSGEKEWERN